MDCSLRWRCLAPQEASAARSATEELCLHRQLRGPGHVHLLPQEYLYLGKGSSDAIFQILFLTWFFFFNTIKVHPYFFLLGFGAFPIFHKLRQQ